MALAQPITISQQANFLQLALDAYANPLGGEAKVVSNLKDYWSQAKLSSQKPTILVCYQGDVARGPFEQANAWVRVDRQWSVAVIRGRGFTSNRGDTLNSSQGGQIPFYDVVEQVRELLRSLLGISEELPTIDFKSIKPMSMGSDPLDGYEIQFSTANDLPMISISNPNKPS